MWTDSNITANFGITWVVRIYSEIVRTEQTVSRVDHDRAQFFLHLLVARQQGFDLAAHFFHHAGFFSYRDQGKRDGIKYSRVPGDRGVDFSAAFNFLFDLAKDGS